MVFFDWLLSMRKKPLEERRRFVAFFTVIVTACVTAVWFLCLITFGPLRFQDGVQTESVATPSNITLPEIPPFPAMPDFSDLKK